MRKNYLGWHAINWSKVQIPRFKCNFKSKSAKHWSTLCWCDNESDNYVAAAAAADDDDDVNGDDGGGGNNDDGVNDDDDDDDDDDELKFEKKEQLKFESSYEK